MTETYDFETTPYEETCQQLGNNYNPTLARLEAKTLIEQLERQFPEQPDGSWFKIKSNPHEFGNYYSVQLVYDDEDEKHQNFLHKLEENFPKNWDEQSNLTLQGGNNENHRQN